MSRETFKKTEYIKDSKIIHKQTWNKDGRHYEELFTDKDGKALENSIVTYTSDEPNFTELIETKILEADDIIRFNPKQAKIGNYLIGRVMEIVAGDVIFKSTEIEDYFYFIRFSDIINKDIDIGDNYKAVVLEHPSDYLQDMIHKIELFKVVE